MEELADKVPYSKYETLAVFEKDHLGTRKGFPNRDQLGAMGGKDCLAA